MTAPKSSETSEAIKTTAAAIALADRAHETSVALAKAKVDSDVIAAIQTNDISYIKKDIGEIKDSLKTMRDDFVTHPEFAEAIKSIQEQIKPLKSVIYGLVAVILLGVLGAVLKLIILQ